MMECVFCDKIDQGRDEHGSVYTTPDPGTVRFAPLNPVTPGHMLFVPRRHAWHSYNIGKAMEQADQWGWQGSSYNLIVSNGPPASQTVMHPHIHFVPRFWGDELSLPWTNKWRSR